MLTLDFAIKMLNIHERAECGVPVIIEGETGVGKTALIEMLSKLWNFSLSRNWTLFRDRVLDYIKRRLDSKEAAYRYSDIVNTVQYILECVQQDIEI